MFLFAERLRFELRIFGFGDRRLTNLANALEMEREIGIEPMSMVYKTMAKPLSYTRIVFICIEYRPKKSFFKCSTRKYLKKL